MRKIIFLIFFVLLSFITNAQKLENKEDIISFQKYANTKGENLVADGIWGPKTAAAFSKWGSLWIESRLNVPDENLKKEKPKKVEESNSEKKKRKEKSSSSELRRWSIELVLNPTKTSVLGNYYVPKGDNNSGTLRYSSISGSKRFTPGIETGISFSYHFSKKFGIELGTFYASAGQDFFTYNGEFDDGTDKYPFTFYRYVTLSYLKFPLVFRFNTNPERKIRFSAHTGFYFSILLGYSDFNSIDSSNSKSYTYFSSGYYYSQSDSWGYSYNTNLNSRAYNSTDLGLIFGAGISIKVSKRVSIPIVFNYQIGLSDIKNHSSSYSNRGDRYYYWQYWEADSHDKNYLSSYFNSSFGFQTGVNMKL